MHAPRITAHTRLIALLGDPVGHSRSPEIHNAAFAASGLDYAYLAFRVAPADLPAAVQGMRALGIAGANVTIPHKEAIIPLLDACTETARGVGAVNTVMVEPGEPGTDTLRLVGDNTDVEGFLDALAPFEGTLHGADMLVWGAGGAARAVVYALLTRYAPHRLTIVARRAEQADRLAAAMRAYAPETLLGTATFDTMPEAVRQATLLVNTTPLGMHPHSEATPAPSTGFTPGQIVYDLVYTPAETRLLRDAASAGATPVGGWAMLQGQAARAFTRWTGQAMPLFVPDPSRL